MFGIFSRFNVINRSIEKAVINKVLNNINNSFVSCGIPSQCFHMTCVKLKKRRAEDEKKTENKTGRQVIRFSPKAKTNKVVDIWPRMSIRDIAEAVEKDTDHVLDAIGFSPHSTGEYHENSIVFDTQVIKDVIKISGCKFKFVLPPEERKSLEPVDKDAYPAPPSPPENLMPRCPVVTVMGHVDHGKTTLLDSLRNTSVVAQEFGGITQHIGAFQVNLKNGEVVTFLDTPGHAAFKAMRARGANVTDIVVLVVAADDGVMEQTIESIKMANSAKVPIIVAVNKCDKPTADIERTHRLLAQESIIVEQMGGEVQSVAISALKKHNLDVLVETISLQAQLKELKADPTGLVEGVIVESETDPQKGKLATMIVQRGTLKTGCVLVAGNVWGKVRFLMSHDGTPVELAPPSTPVQVAGWKGLPSAGDQVLQVENEKRAAEVMKWRHVKNMEDKQKLDHEAIALKAAEQRAIYKEYLQKKRLLGRFKLKPEGPRPKQYVESNEPTLNIVIKGDVDGSVEAILDILDSYDDSDNCKFDLVHFGVGQVNESDVEIAEPFKAIIYAFNVECSEKVENLAKELNVSIKHHNVIYKVVDDIKEELNLRIPMSQAEELLGEANVQQPFTINERRKKVSVAGCRCLKGVLKKSGLYRILRGENEVVFEGEVTSMKNFKDEVDTIKKDMECGLRFSDPNIEIKAGDRIVCYHMIDVKNFTKWDPGF